MLLTLSSTRLSLWRRARKFSHLLCYDFIFQLCHKSCEDVFLEFAESKIWFSNELGKYNKKPSGEPLRKHAEKK
jgi:hypothetical protein